MGIEFYIGKREQISIGEESVYGTTVTPDIVLARDSIVDPSDIQNWVEIRQAAIDSVNIEQREISIKTREPTLNFAPQDWRFLKFVLTDGSNGVVDAGSDPFTHTFTNKSNVSSFTLERAMRITGTDLVQTYEGCQVNSMTLAWDAGGGAGGALVKTTLECLARDRNDGTATSSVSIPTTAAFQYRNVTLTLDGVEQVNHLGGSMSIENTLHPARYANRDTTNQVKGESAVQLRRIAGTFRVLVKDDFFATRFQSEAVIANSKVVFERATGDDCVFTLVDLRIVGDPTPTDLDTINEVTLAWVAKETTVVATDSIATY